MKSVVFLEKVFRGEGLVAGLTLPLLGDVVSLHVLVERHVALESLVTLGALKSLG